MTIKERLHSNAAEGGREAAFVGMELAVASEWMFSPEIRSGKVRRVLGDWTLPQVDLWVVFPAGRNVSRKARAFANFIEAELRAEFAG